MSYMNHTVSLGIPTLKSPKEMADMEKNILKYIDCIDEYFFTCINQSAARNRNECINRAKGDILIMADDDIVFNIKGWATMLVEALAGNELHSIASIRPKHADGSYCHILGDSGNQDKIGKYQKCIHTPATGLNICGSACIAFWRNCGVIFDERYLGACYEDSDFCMQMNKEYPDKEIVFVNECNIIHNEERKGRGSSPGKRDNWQHNHDYFKNKHGIEI